MLEDAETLLEMCAEDDDPALAEEADAAVNSLDAKVEELRLLTLLNGCLLYTSRCVYETGPRSRWGLLSSSS